MRYAFLSAVLTVAVGCAQSAERHEASAELQREQLSGIWRLEYSCPCVGRFTFDGDGYDLEMVCNGLSATVERGDYVVHDQAIAFTPSSSMCARLETYEVSTDREYAYPFMRPEDAAYREGVTPPTPVDTIDCAHGMFADAFAER